MERITVTVTEAVRLTGVSRTAIFKLIQNESIESLKVGKRRLITTASLRRFFAAGPENSS